MVYSTANFVKLVAGLESGEERNCWEILIKGMRPYWTVDTTLGKVLEIERRRNAKDKFMQNLHDAIYIGVAAVTLFRGL